MGERWIAEAEDLKTGSHPGTMEGGAPKVTWHVTVSPSGGGYFDAMHRVLVDNASEPHVLYDPVTDRLGQYFPLDSSARALRNDGARRTNGSGLVNIQIEVVAMADDFTRYWKPGPNFRALMRAIRSWGVPDAWPGGNPFGQPLRSWDTYTKPGHFGHVHVPGNDHTDPQIRDGSLLFAAAPQEDDLSAADVKAINDYTAALLLNGYSSGGQQKPALLDILVETQRRVTGITAALTALASTLPDAAAQKVLASLNGTYEADVTLKPKV